MCYAPQFGSAKDPVNMAGMIAANVIRGDARIAHWEDLERTPALILDVRDPAEFKSGSIPGAAHIPLGELRRRMGELPRDRDIWAYCFVGQRSYYASRALAAVRLPDQKHQRRIQDLPAVTAAGPGTRK